MQSDCLINLLVELAATLHIVRANQQRMPLAPALRWRLHKYKVITSLRPRRHDPFENTFGGVGRGSTRRRRLGDWSSSADSCCCRDKFAAAGVRGCFRELRDLVQTIHFDPSGLPLAHGYAHIYLAEPAR